MSDDRRNPYVLLGLPYGAGLAEAQRAFARRSRDARWGDRRDSDRAELDLGDLTWALEQIESHQLDAAAGYGTFRIPTHRHALEPPDGYGLLRPAPRPAPRQAAPVSDDELAAVFDAARLDAAQHLLDRTAAAVGKRLEHLPEEPVPTATVASVPVRRRGWAPVIGVAAAFAAVLAAAGIRTLVMDDDNGTTATTTVTTVTTPATVESTTSSTTSTTLVALPSETFGDPITRDGITITPAEPLDAFGHLCIVFTVEGDVPLGFVRSRVALISDGVVVAPALDINTGRAEITDVFGNPSPATREICFPTTDWQAHTTFLEYATDGGSYRWLISEPAGPASG